MFVVEHVYPGAYPNEVEYYLPNREALDALKNALREHPSRPCVLYNASPVDGVHRAWVQGLSLDEAQKVLGGMEDGGE